jgi:hypothetical protein
MTSFVLSHSDKKLFSAINSSFNPLILSVLRPRYLTHSYWPSNSYHHWTLWRSRSSRPEITRRLITILSRTRHWSRWIHILMSYLFKISFNIILLCRLRSNKQPFISGFSTKILYAFYISPIRVQIKDVPSLWYDLTARSNSSLLKMLQPMVLNLWDILYKYFL